MTAKIHGWKPSTYQPNPNNVRMVVDCALHDTRTTESVFWSKSFNSYVLAEIAPGNTWANYPEKEQYFWRIGDKLVQLVSINGGGEVRWSVTKDRLEQDEDYEEKCKHEGRENHGDGVEFLAAARHFNLIPKE